MSWKAVEVYGGGAIVIAGIVAALFLACYGLWWISLLAASRFPMIGKRHRHKDWTRLNRP